LQIGFFVRIIFCEKILRFCFSRGEFVYLSKDEKSKRHNALGGAVPQYQKARRIPFIAARERLSACGTNSHFLSS
jgi:hypothetical protein